MRETLFSYSMDIKEIVPTPKEFLLGYEGIKLSILAL